MTARSKALQIYMKPGVAEDDLMLAIWEAARRSSRPQDVFRAMLRAGLRAMVESGEMPDAVMRECELDEVFERRRRRESRNADTRSRVGEPPAHPAMHVPHFAPPYPYGYAPPVPMPMHPMAQPGYAPAHQVVPPPAPAPAALTVAAAAPVPAPSAAPPTQAVRPEALAEGVATVLGSASAEARIQRDTAADPADHREAAPAAVAPARKGRIGALM